MANRRVMRSGVRMLLLVLALDQGSKWYFLQVSDLPYFQPISVTPFFDLVMVWNKGISFGMFSSQNQPYLLIALSAVIVFILWRWLATAGSRWIAGAIGAIIGGALGNVIDRLRFGAVADFFDFHMDIYHWPAFNVADSAIFIGVVILCADSMFGGRK
jgi:signal peptidase II